MPGFLEVTTAARSVFMMLIVLHTTHTANLFQKDLQVLALFLLAGVTARIRGIQVRLQSNLNFHPPVLPPFILRHINTLVAALPSIQELLHNSKKNWFQNE